MGLFCPCKKPSWIRNSVSPLFNKKYLHSGDDLNNCRQPGVYYCHTNEIANTIQNRPNGLSNRGFLLLVFNILGDDYTCQMIWRHDTGQKFYRYWDYQMSILRPWRQMY